MPEDHDASGEVVAALGSGVRLALLAEAARHERTNASELAAALKLPIPNVSYHVRVLAASGLFTAAGKREVHGVVQRYYRLDTNAARVAADALEQLATTLRRQA